MTSTSVALSWSPVLYREGIQNYKVYRNGVSVGSPTGTSYTDSNLTASTTYNYQVSAVGKDGVESAKSPIVKATTKAETTGTG